MLSFLKSLLFLSFMTSFAFADACCTSCAHGHVCESERKIIPTRYPQLLVFVSFSMPMQTLQTVAQQVNAVGGSLVFRGLVEGSFPQMAVKLKELGQEALIDPTLFDAYQVTSVPTFILRENPSEDAHSKTPHDRLSGNVSLRHVLETFGKEGSTLAQNLLSQLKG